MIFPIPKNEEYFDGLYTLKNKNLCKCKLLDLYNEIKNGISEIQLSKDETLKKEEYKITVTADKIDVTYSENEGLFRAVTSLYQLIKKQGCSIRCCEITDSPNVKRRGYMVEISCGKMPNVRTIKNLIDHLAELKYNEFQLYMDSFCFKYKNFPEYTKDFDCLAPEDIIELDAYCKERFIDLVPNQNSFGHMHAWIEQEELRHLGIIEGDDNTGTLNPELPESVEFVDKLYDSLLPYFSSKYVNIGLDEADGLGKYQSEEYVRKNGISKVFADYFTKLNKLVNEKYGKTAMFWCDSLDRHEGTHELVPKNTIAMEWGYDLIQSQIMMESCVKHKEHGLPFYVCPSCNLHCSFTGRTDVMTFNMRTAGEIAEKLGADGYLVTDWGEPPHPCFWIWSLFPSALGAQYAWNSGFRNLGFSFKKDYIEASWEYIDNKFFDGCKVTQLLSQLGNYYLLEKERIHNGTLSSNMFRMSLDTNVSPIKDYEDVFTNENVKNFVKHYWDLIEEKPIDENFKKQVSLNCRMIILSEDFSNIRLGHNVTEEKINELIGTIETLKKDYVEMWTLYNYMKGSERFVEMLDKKISELKSFI